MWIEAIKAHVGDGSFLLVSRWLHEEGHWLMYVVMAAPECPAGASARWVEEAGVAKTCGRDVSLVLDRVQPQAPLQHLAPQPLLAPPQPQHQNSADTLVRDRVLQWEHLQQPRPDQEPPAPLQHLAPECAAEGFSFRG